MKRGLHRPDLVPEDSPVSKMKDPHRHFSAQNALSNKEGVRLLQETNNKKQGGDVSITYKSLGRASHRSLLKKENYKSSTINNDRKDNHRQSQRVQLNQKRQFYPFSTCYFAPNSDPNPQNGRKQHKVMQISIPQMSYTEKEPFSLTPQNPVPGLFIEPTQPQPAVQSFEGDNSEVLNCNRNLMIKKNLGDIEVSVIYYQDQQQHQHSLSVLYQDCRKKIKADAQITQSILTSSNSPVKDTRTFYSLLVDALEEERENISNVIRIEGSCLIFVFKQGNKLVESFVKAHFSVVRESEKSKEEAECRFKINILGFVLKNVLFLQKNIRRFLAEQTANLKQEIKQLHTSISNLQTHIKARLEQQIDLSMVEFKNLLVARIQSFQSRIDYLQSDLRQPLTSVSIVLQDHTNQISFFEHQLEKTKHKMNVRNDELHAKLSELVISANSNDQNNQAELRYMDEVLKTHSGHIAELQRRIMNEKSQQSIEKLKQENADSDQDGEFFIQKRQWFDPISGSDTEITRYQEHCQAHLQYELEKNVKKKQK